MGIGRRFGGFAAGACALALLAGRPAGAQDVTNLRVTPHPVRVQVGYVTDVSGQSAWIKMPQRLRAGARIDFLAFSDGVDALFSGTVTWVTPIAPYEAYVTDIRALSKRHTASDYASLTATEALTKATAV